MSVMRRFLMSRGFLVFGDMVVINLAFLLALVLRFDLAVPAPWWGMYTHTFLLYSLISFFVFSRAQFYHHDWRYMTAKNIIRLSGGVAISVFVYMLVLYFIHHWTFPRVVILLGMVLAVVFTTGLRLAIHTLYSWKKNGSRAMAKRVLIIGAGDAGEGLARDILRAEPASYNPVGFLDDDPLKKGVLIHGIPVLGRISEVKTFVRRKGVEEVIISIPSAHSDEMRRIVTLCELSGVEVKKVPSLISILDGTVSISAIKNVEPEDLLGREPNLADREDIIKYLRGKVIMVTGAGGSIGSELCRQILGYQPKQLILLDSSEHHVYSIDMELSSMHKTGKPLHIPLVANVQHKNKMDHIFDQFRPEVVFHAAAYKHVPLMERNVDAAVKNNIWGTYNVATLAAKYHVKRFVMISTDKAVNPTNVMGASKRLAEMVIQSLNGHSVTVFSAVRFGNVLDSNGSVLPLFKKQIAEGGPVTVTHPDVVRYFMTIPEAVQLVLTAATMAHGGEIYVLEMGEPVRILDMAKSLIKLSGFEPDKDIKIEIVGLRPGEKLYEELLTSQEGVQKTANNQIYVEKPRSFDKEKLILDVEELWQLADVRDIPGVLAKMKRVVPEFSSSHIHAPVPAREKATEVLRRGTAGNP